VRAELQLQVRMNGKVVEMAHWRTVLADATGEGESGLGGGRCYSLRHALPFGLALYWAERCNQGWSGEQAVEMRSGVGIEEVLHWWLNQLDMDLQQWRNRGIDMLREGEEVHASRLQLKVEVRTAVHAQSGGAGQEMPPVPWASLMGCSLLLSELERWLTAQGVPCQEGTIYTQGWIRTLQRASDAGQVELTAGIRVLESGELCCNRCGAGEDALHWRSCAACGTACPYCEQCLQLGRVRLCSPLVRGLPSRAANVAQRRSASEAAAPDLRSWHLSPAQQDAVERGLQFLHESVEDDRRECANKGEAPSFLIWAVTGAGKTEMVYPLIEYELTRGGRVLVAAPRKDVVMELKPRLQRAFPQCRVVALYGGSEDTWKEGDLVLATTHQLLRFDRAFDLAVIDELDAFPYHNNPMLHYAASRALADDGRRILLSATPTAELKRAARRQQLPHALVYVRYHRHPLPVPRLVRTRPLAKSLKAGRHKDDSAPLARLLGRWAAYLRTGLSRKLVRSMRSSIQRGAQLFVFVPRIADTAPTAHLLRTEFPAERVDSVHAQDADRLEKVEAFRQGTIRILVTTTILERGVTVPRTDVYILDAHRSPFDATSLVQMAGRAGRSSDDPAGLVVFAAPYRNMAQVRAIREIKQMNRWAKRKGYLLQVGKEMRERE